MFVKFDGSVLNFIPLFIKKCDYNITLVHKREKNHMFVCATNGLETLCCDMVGHCRDGLNMSLGTEGKDKNVCSVIKMGMVTADMD